MGGWSVGWEREESGKLWGSDLGYLKEGVAVIEIGKTGEGVGLKEDQKLVVDPLSLRCQFSVTLLSKLSTGSH